MICKVCGTEFDKVDNIGLCHYCYCTTQNIDFVKQKLNKLQNDNKHSEYMLEVARFCNDDKYIKIFEHICDLHELDGCLIYCLGDYRNFQWENLKEKYEDKLKPLGIFPISQYDDTEIPF